MYYSTNDVKEHGAYHTLTRSTDWRHLRVNKEKRDLEKRVWKMLHIDYNVHLKPDAFGFWP